MQEIFKTVAQVALFALPQVALRFLASHLGVPLEHACGGSCACTTCHVIVREGEDHLSAMEQDEEDRLDTAEGLTLHSRLGRVKEALTRALSREPTMEEIAAETARQPTASDCTRSAARARLLRV